MARPVFREFETFLKILHRQKSLSVPHFIRAASRKVVRAFIEIAYNLLKGDIPLTPNQIKYLKKDKDLLKFLIGKKKPLNKKRAILYENPSLVKHMLNVVFY